MIVENGHMRTVEVCLPPGRFTRKAELVPPCLVGDFGVLSEDG